MAFLGDLLLADGTQVQKITVARLGYPSPKYYEEGREEVGSFLNIAARYR